MGDNNPNAEGTQPQQAAPQAQEEVKTEPPKKTFVSINDVEYEKRYALMKREIENGKALGSLQLNSNVANRARSHAAS